MEYKISINNCKSDINSSIEKEKQEMFKNGHI